ncbi:MAG: lysophospholipid acyltransferase family protein [Bacteroidota bacterium]
MKKNLRGYFRFFLFIVLVLFYLTRYLIGALFKGRDLKRGLNYRLKFAHAIRKVIGVDIEVKGSPPDHPALYVGNHRTYYDPGGVSLDVPMSVVVAKAEIRDWPLIGYATDFIGIIFVDRNNPDSRKATRVAMADALERGFSVLIYPEGTTGDRPTTLPFSPGTFAMAVKMGVPIVPIAMEYKHPADAWISRTQSFASHYIQTYSKKRTPVKIRYGEPMFDENVETFMAKVKAWIDENLLEIQAEFGGVAWESKVDDILKQKALEQAKKAAS